MKIISVLLLVLCAQSYAQTHATSVEQCRADVALWGDDYAQTKYFEAETEYMQSNVKNRTDYAALSLVEVKSRLGEMSDCMEIDAPNSDKYYKNHQFWFEVMADRWILFLGRHNLIKRLEKEDAEGLR